MQIHIRFTKFVFFFWLLYSLPRKPSITICRKCFNIPFLGAWRNYVCVCACVRACVCAHSDALKQLKNFREAFHEGYSFNPLFAVHQVQRTPYKVTLILQIPPPLPANHLNLQSATKYCLKLRTRKTGVHKFSGYLAATLQL
jgi:hypothetical protein